MPLFSGVSNTSTVDSLRRKPRPLAHARCDFLQPIRLLHKVIFKVLEPRLSFTETLLLLTVIELSLLFLAILLLVQKY